MVLAAFLEYLNIQFHIERMLSKQSLESGTTENLLRVSLELLTTIIGVFKPQKARQEVEGHFPWIVRWFG